MIAKLLKMKINKFYFFENSKKIKYQNIKR